MLKNIKILYEYRELLISIATRDIKVRYKQSFLGIGWALLQPLSLMVVFTLVFSRFAKVPTNGIPYPIFSYCALLPWILFANSLSYGIPSLVNNIHLVTKIYFPREIFPIATIFACFIDFLIGSIIFIGLLFYYKISISIYILFIPILLIIQILLTLGIVFFLSALNVFFRDIKHIIPLAVQLWMFLSPVAYSLSSVPDRFRGLYIFNPMVGILDGYRAIILSREMVDINSLIISFTFSIVLFFFSYRFFKKMEMKFADII